MRSAMERRRVATAQPSGDAVAGEALGSVGVLGVCARGQVSMLARVGASLIRQAWGVHRGKSRCRSSTRWPTPSTTPTSAHCATTARAHAPWTAIPPSRSTTPPRALSAPPSRWWPGTHRHRRSERQRDRLSRTQPGRSAPMPRPLLSTPGVARSRHPDVAEAIARKALRREAKGIVASDSASRLFAWQLW